METINDWREFLKHVVSLKYLFTRAGVVVGDFLN
jgi:hypothetical protein